VGEFSGDRFGTTGGRANDEHAFTGEDRKDRAFVGSSLGARLKREQKKVPEGSATTMSKDKSCRRGFTEAVLWS